MEDIYFFTLKKNQQEKDWPVFLAKRRKLGQFRFKIYI